MAKPPNATQAQANSDAWTSQLIAETNDPWIGVHVLTEFVFCPRAGVMTYETQDDDIGDEDRNRATHRDFLPRWEMHSIERALSATTAEVKQRIAQVNDVLHRSWPWAAGLIVFGVVVGLISSMWRVPGSAAGLVFLVGLCYLLEAGAAIFSRRKKMAELAELRDLALAAEPQEPRDGFQENCPINWWSLWKSGFDSVSYKDPLRSQRWRLSGRPWRVLRRGSLRIPVFRKRNCDRVNGRRLYRQHYARLAAYCKLLEECEGAQSPFGIVMFDDTYEGPASPANTIGSWVALRDGLRSSRERLHVLRQNGPPPVPPERQGICKGCGHGKPFVHRVGETEHELNGETLPVFGCVGVDSRVYHSHCGDRFHWLPPHAKARDKELRANY